MNYIISDYTYSFNQIPLPSASRAKIAETYVLFIEKSPMPPPPSSRRARRALQHLEISLWLRLLLDGSHFPAPYFPLLLDLDTILPHWFIRIGFFDIDKPKAL